MFHLRHILGIQIPRRVSSNGLIQQNEKIFRSRYLRSRLLKNVQSAPYIPCKFYETWISPCIASKEQYPTPQSFPFRRSVLTERKVSHSFANLRNRFSTSAIINISKKGNDGKDDKKNEKQVRSYAKLISDYSKEIDLKKKTDSQSKEESPAKNLASDVSKSGHGTDDSSKNPRDLSDTKNAAEWLRRVESVLKNLASNKTSRKDVPDGKVESVEGTNRTEERSDWMDRIARGYKMEKQVRNLHQDSAKTVTESAKKDRGLGMPSTSEFAIRVERRNSQVTFNMQPSNTTISTDLRTSSDVRLTVNSEMKDLEISVNQDANRASKEIEFQVGGEKSILDLKKVDIYNSTDKLKIRIPIDTNSSVLNFRVTDLPSRGTPGTDGGLNYPRKFEPPISKTNVKMKGASSQTRDAKKAAETYPKRTSHRMGLDPAKEKSSTNSSPGWKAEKETSRAGKPTRNWKQSGDSSRQRTPPVSVTGKEGNSKRDENAKTLARENPVAAKKETSDKREETSVAKTKDSRIGTGSLKPPVRGYQLEAPLRKVSAKAINSHREVPPIPAKFSGLKDAVELKGDVLSPGSGPLNLKSSLSSKDTSPIGRKPGKTVTFVKEVPGNRFEPEIAKPKAETKKPDFKMANPAASATEGSKVRDPSANLKQTLNESTFKSDTNPALGKPGDKIGTQMEARKAASPATTSQRRKWDLATKPESFQLQNPGKVSTTQKLEVSGIPKPELANKPTSSNEKLESPSTDGKKVANMEGPKLNPEKTFVKPLVEKETKPPEYKEILHYRKPEKSSSIQRVSSKIDPSKDRNLVKPDVPKQSEKNFSTAKLKQDLETSKSAERFAGIGMKPFPINKQSLSRIKENLAVKKMENEAKVGSSKEESKNQEQEKEVQKAKLSKAFEKEVVGIQDSFQKDRVDKQSRVQRRSPKTEGISSEGEKKEKERQTAKLSKAQEREVKEIKEFLKSGEMEKPKSDGNRKSFVSPEKVQKTNENMKKVSEKMVQGSSKPETKFSSKSPLGTLKTVEEVASKATEKSTVVAKQNTAKINPGSAEVAKGKDELSKEDEIVRKISSTPSLKIGTQDLIGEIQPILGTNSGTGREILKSTKSGKAKIQSPHRSVKQFLKAKKPAARTVNVINMGNKRIGGELTTSKSIKGLSNNSTAKFEPVKKGVPSRRSSSINHSKSDVMLARIGRKRSQEEQTKKSEVGESGEKGMKPQIILSKKSCTRVRPVSAEDKKPVPSDAEVQKLLENMKPIEKRKDGILIDYGVKIDTRKKPDEKRKIVDRRKRVQSISPVKPNVEAKSKEFPDSPKLKIQSSSSSAPVSETRSISSTRKHAVPVLTDYEENHIFSGPEAKKKGVVGGNEIDPSGGKMGYGGKSTPDPSVGGSDTKAKSAAPNSKAPVSVVEEYPSILTTIGTRSMRKFAARLKAKSPATNLGSGKGDCSKKKPAFDENKELLYTIWLQKFDKKVPKTDSGVKTSD